MSEKCKWCGRTGTTREMIVHTKEENAELRAKAQVDFESYANMVEERTDERDAARAEVEPLKNEILWFQEQAKPHGGTLEVYSKIDRLIAENKKLKHLETWIENHGLHTTAKERDKFKAALELIASMEEPQGELVATARKALGNQ